MNPSVDCLMIDNYLLIVFLVEVTPHPKEEQ